MSAVRPPMRGRASWQASASGQSSRPIAFRGSPDSACGSSACARSGCADPLARRSTECIGHPSCSSHPTCPRSGEEAASATDAWAAAAARTRPRPVSAATRADGEAGWVWRARGYRVPLGQGLTLRMASRRTTVSLCGFISRCFSPLPGRIEQVAQPIEDHLLLVAAQRQQRHRDVRAPRSYLYQGEKSGR